jgi:hypothetical protein
MVVFGLRFYLSGAAVLIGAEVNAELLEAAYKKLLVKEVAPLSSGKSENIQREAPRQSVSGQI